MVEISEGGMSVCSEEDNDYSFTENPFWCRGPLDDLISGTASSSNAFESASDTDVKMEIVMESEATNCVSDHEYDGSIRGGFYGSEMVDEADELMLALELCSGNWHDSSSRADLEITEAESSGSGGFETSSQWIGYDNMIFPGSQVDPLFGGENEEVNLGDMEMDNDERIGPDTIMELPAGSDTGSEVNFSDESGEYFDFLLEWEFLWVLSYLERAERDRRYVSREEYESFEEHFDGGNPPAANLVVNNLPVVRLMNEDLGKEEKLSCGVCKDEMSMEVMVTKLPCIHYYHTDCILPWLRIRNTCPLCRYELPTDYGEHRSWS